MANRRLSEVELASASALLEKIRARLNVLSGGDRELRFALNRKIYKELGYDERSKPMARRRLKIAKFNEQNGRCAECGKPLGEKYSVLDRRNAVDGYTAANTRLVHPDCDYKKQASKGYA
jgi:hypothetical protein